MQAFADLLKEQVLDSWLSCTICQNLAVHIDCVHAFSLVAAIMYLNSANFLSAIRMHTVFCKVSGVHCIYGVSKTHCED